MADIGALPLKKRLGKVLLDISATMAESDSSGGTLVQLWMPEHCADGSVVLSAQGLPFSLCGVGDLLALFRCVSIRYRFSTDVMKPSLMGMIGRVYSSMEPEYTNDLQQLDKTSYLRVSEARRCRVHSTLVVPLFSPDMMHKPMAIFELVQSDKACDFEAVMGSLKRSLQSVQMYTVDLERPRAGLNQRAGWRSDMGRSFSHTGSAKRDVDEAVGMRLENEQEPGSEDSGCGSAGSLKRSCAADGNVGRDGQDANCRFDAQFPSRPSSKTEEGLRQAAAAPALGSLPSLHQADELTEWMAENKSSAGMLEGVWSVLPRPLEHMGPCPENQQQPNDLKQQQQQQHGGALLATSFLRNSAPPGSSAGGLQKPPDLPPAMPRHRTSIAGLARDEMDDANDDISSSGDDADSDGEGRGERGSGNRAGGGAGRRLKYEDLQAQFGVGLKEAAANMGICATTLKRACRRHGIKRWPRRQIAKLSKTLTQMGYSGSPPPVLLQSAVKGQVGQQLEGSLVGAAGLARTSSEAQLQKQQLKVLKMQTQAQQMQLKAQQMQQELQQRAMLQGGMPLGPCLGQAADVSTVPSAEALHLLGAAPGTAQEDERLHQLYSVFRSDSSDNVGQVLHGGAVIHSGGSLSGAGCSLQPAVTQAGCAVFPGREGFGSGSLLGASQVMSQDLWAQHVLTNGGGFDGDGYDLSAQPPCFPQGNSNQASLPAHSFMSLPDSDFLNSPDFMDNMDEGQATSAIRDNGMELAGGMELTSGMELASGHNVIVSLSELLGCEP